MFDTSEFFTTAQSGVNGMSFDIGFAFTALIGILIVVQGLELLIDVLGNRINRKSERQEYEEWKSNKERLARWNATYESETNAHGPTAPKRSYTSNYL